MDVLGKIAILLISFLIFVMTVNANQIQSGEKQAVILMYHHFGVNKYPTTNIQLKQFEDQLEYLAQNDYKIWPLRKVAEYIRDNKKFPGHVVSITVDDAYISVYTEAFPRLRKRNWPFTVFVSTDGVDKGYKSYMSWEQMREMQNHGATFANHSSSHDYLIRRLKDETAIQWKERIIKDIKHAQNRLKEEMGDAPMLFAYPYGEYSTQLAKLVANMGYISFGQHSGPARSGDSLLALPRFPMSENFASMPDFKQKVKSLAFPIINQSPWEPTLSSSGNPPLLEIMLGDSDAQLKQISCFVSGQGRVGIKWISQKDKIFSVQAKLPLPAGRSRYNCTAPSEQNNRYYWYSHLWINQVTGTR